MNKVVEGVLHALRAFGAAVTRKTAGLAAGEPEDQLRGPFELFLQEAGAAIGPDVVTKGEFPVPGRVGKPDYAVLTDKLLAGYAELKAPGAGADPDRFNQYLWVRVIERSAKFALPRSHRTRGGAA
ncbi:MAG: hypothetical protein ABSH49_00595 [Bryobacteraceae bacterium]